MIWHVHDRTGDTFTIREQVEPDDEAGLLALFSVCEDWNCRRGSDGVAVS